MWGGGSDEKLGCCVIGDDHGSGQETVASHPTGPDVAWGEGGTQQEEPCSLLTGHLTCAAGWKTDGREEGGPLPPRFTR